jgi:aspartyl-tRNA synthetase
MNKIFINKLLEKKNNKHFILNIFKNNIDKKIIIQGRLKNNFRDFGKIIFFTLKLYFFKIQCISNKAKLNDIIKKTNNNSIIEINGIIKKIKKSNKLSKNIDIFFSQIEININDFKIIQNSTKDPEKFIQNNLIEKASKNRYLMIKNINMLKIIQNKTKLYLLIHQFFNKLNFLYIDTPTLSFDTPEGAKSFIIKDKKISLSQSPQLYKELILLNSEINFPGYFQIAKCFRNEDLRSDRQYEFTQLDIEIITNNIKKIKNIIEKFLKFIILKLFNRKDIIFLDLNYDDSIYLFNIDKPNIENASNDFTIVNKINNQIFIKLDKKVFFNHIFFNKIKKEFNIIKKNNNYIINYNKINKFKKKYQQIINKYNNFFKFIWIENFPLFEKKDNKLTYSHHPFVEPINIDKFRNIITKKNNNNLIEELLKLKGSSFDLVFKGNEILSGSLRISDYKMQEKILTLIKENKKNIEKEYGFFLNAFKYAPNSIGGCAIGLDRLLTNLLNYSSIKSSLLFPRSKSGIDILLNYE